jgi:hypothetical protein
MYQFGGFNNNMPSRNTMFGADAQTYYSQASYTPSMQSYKSPNYAMEDFGLSQQIKHKMIGMPVGIGQEHASRDIGQKEQQSLFRAVLGFDASSAAVNIGAGTAGIYASSLMGGLATGGIGIAGGMVIDAAKETYMENYRRTSSVAGITNRIVGKDGGRGLSKDENVDITKFLGEMAADDPLLDIQDATNIMKMASSHGMLNSTATATGVKKKLKELTNTLKEVADITGSSDLQGLMGQLKKFNMLGVESVDAKNIISNLTYNADISGFDRSTLKNYNDSAMMSAKTTGMSIGTISANTARAATDAGLIRQSSSSGTLLSDDNAYTSAAQEMSTKAAMYTKKRGAGADQRIIIAEQQAKQSGSTIQEELNRLSTKPLSEITEIGRIVGGKIQDQSERSMYNRRLSSSSEAHTYIETNSKLNKLDAGADIDLLSKEIASNMKKLNIGIAEAISNLIGSNHTGKGLGYLVGKVGIEADPHKKNQQEANRRKTAKAVENRAISQNLARMEEKHTFGTKVLQIGGHIADTYRNVVGGYGLAAGVNTFAQDRYSGGVYGGAGKERYQDSGFAKLAPLSIGILGIDKVSSQPKEANILTANDFRVKDGVLSSHSTSGTREAYSSNMPSANYVTDSVKTRMIGTKIRETRSDAINEEYESQTSKDRRTIESIYKELSEADFSSSVSETMGAAISIHKGDTETYIAKTNKQNKAINFKDLNIGINNKQQKILTNINSRHKSGLIQPIEKDESPYAQSKAQAQSSFIDNMLDLRNKYATGNISESSYQKGLRKVDTLARAENMPNILFSVAKNNDEDEVLVDTASEAITGYKKITKKNRSVETSDNVKDFQSEDQNFKDKAGDLMHSIMSLDSVSKIQETEKVLEKYYKKRQNGEATTTKGLRTDLAFLGEDDATDIAKKYMRVSGISDTDNHWYGGEHFESSMKGAFRVASEDFSSMSKQKKEAATAVLRDRGLAPSTAKDIVGRLSQGGATVENSEAIIKQILQGDKKGKSMGYREVLSLLKEDTDKKQTEQTLNKTEENTRKTAEILAKIAESYE